MHRILVVGTGSIGERHARCLQKTERATVGIVEINDDLRKQVAERYGFEEVYSSLDEALTKQWDGAVVATPAQTHIPISMTLAEAGVNLLIEKPLATSTDGIEALVAKVKEKNLKTVVAYVYRAHPGLGAMRDKILSGDLGKPMHITVDCGQHFPTFRPAYREIYFTKRETGGGAIQDAITHMLNAGEWLVGPITKLVADADHKALEGVEVEDTVNVLARQGDDGVMGSYTMNMYQAPNRTVIKVVCDKGAAMFELHKDRWRWMDEPCGEWHDAGWDLADRDSWFVCQENAFMDVLEGKSEPLCTLEEGLQTLKVNLAALKSSDENSGWIDIQ